MIEHQDRKAFTPEQLEAVGTYLLQLSGEGGVH
jgi:hypothetical protein